MLIIRVHATYLNPNAPPIFIALHPPPLPQSPLSFTHFEQIKMKCVKIRTRTHYQAPAAADCHINMILTLGAQHANNTWI